MNTGSPDEKRMLSDIRVIAHCLNRIANIMEAQEARALDRVSYDPKTLGAQALWREQVAHGDTILGFSDWLAWQESGDADV